MYNSTTNILKITLFPQILYIFLPKYFPILKPQKICFFSIIIVVLGLNFVENFCLCWYVFSAVEFYDKTKSFFVSLEKQAFTQLQIMAKRKAKPNKESNEYDNVFKEKFFAFVGMPFLPLLCVLALATPTTH